MINEDFKKYVQYPISVSEELFPRLPTYFRELPWYYNYYYKGFVYYAKSYEEAMLMVDFISKIYEEWFNEKRKG